MIYNRVSEFVTPQVSYATILLNFVKSCNLAHHINLRYIINFILQDKWEQSYEAKSKKLYVGYSIGFNSKLALRIGYCSNPRFYVILET